MLLCDFRVNEIPIASSLDIISILPVLTGKGRLVVFLFLEVKTEQIVCWLILFKLVILYFLRFMLIFVWSCTLLYIFRLVEGLRLVRIVRWSHLSELSGFFISLFKWVRLLILRLTYRIRIFKHTRLFLQFFSVRFRVKGLLLLNLVHLLTLEHLIGKLLLFFSHWMTYFKAIIFMFIIINNIEFKS